MIKTYGREYVIRDGDSQRYIDGMDEHAREAIVRQLVRECDLTEPMTVRLLKEEGRLTLNETFVRYRLETATVTTMEAVIVVPRETEYDRSLWAIARERVSMRWRRFKRWLKAR